MYGLISLIQNCRFSASAQAVNVSGKWNMKVETSAGSRIPVFVLKQTGEIITGTYTGQFGEAE